MSNYELINELRDQAEVIGPGTEYHLLMEAADVIEALDERVAIMMEDADLIEALGERVAIMSVEEDAERAAKQDD